MPFFMPESFLIEDTSCPPAQFIPWRAENISWNIVPRITYFGWRKSVSCLWSSCWDSAVCP